MTECGDKKGTQTGYSRHRNAARKEGRAINACTECLAANAEYVRQHSTNPCLDCGRIRNSRRPYCPDCAKARRERSRLERVWADTIARSLNRKLDLYLFEHGTEKGYQRHRYLNQPACYACLEGHAAHYRAKTGATRRAPKPKPRKREPEVIRWVPVKGVMRALATS